MLKNLLVLSLFLVLNTAYSESTGKLYVLDTPSYITIDTKEPLKLSDFKNVLLATSGFPIDKQVEWNGLKKNKSTEFPRATLLFILSSNQTDDLKAEPITIQEDTDSHFDYLSESIKNTDSIVHFYNGLPSDSELTNLDCSHLNSFHVVDLTDSVTENSIRKITKKFSDKCSSDLLSYLLHTSVPLRSRRQAVVGSGVDPKVTNEAVFYSDQYPAMFNLIFWTSLILGLAVFGIAYGMWNMDPGLDTVIYRMTSQRIKKDQ